jgi:hypothetical protein
VCIVPERITVYRHNLLVTVVGKIFAILSMLLHRNRQVTCTAVTKFNMCPILLTIFIHTNCHIYRKSNFLKHIQGTAEKLYIAWNDVQDPPAMDTNTLET